MDNILLRKKTTRSSFKLYNIFEITSWLWRPTWDSFRPNLILIIYKRLARYVNCNVRLFADDCLLYRNVNNQSDSELLQKDLINLENWKKTWEMKFYPEKCYVIHVTKKKIPLKSNYKLHSHILQPVDNSKYLGVSISHDLDWGHILIT